jgi:16S rRNA G527 N7-methylase RsmG
MLTTTMVEANQKKSVFLREVIRSTGLAGASVSTGRIEHLKANRGSFDAVTVRAVRLDAVLSGAIAQLLRPGGTLMQFIAAGDAGRKLKDFSPASIVHLGAGSDAGIAIYSRLL